MSKRVNSEGEFAYGAGQLNPTRAGSPGLVYDTDDLGYISSYAMRGTKVTITRKQVISFYIFLWAKCGRIFRRPNPRKTDANLKKNKNKIYNNKILNF